MAADEIDQSLLQTIVGNEGDILAVKAASGALDTQRCQILEKGRKRFPLEVDCIERNTAQSDIANSSDSAADRLIGQRADFPKHVGRVERRRFLIAGLDSDAAAGEQVQSVIVCTDLDNGFAVGGGERCSFDAAEG